MQPCDQPEGISVCSKILRRLTTFPPPRYGCVAELAPAPLYVECVNPISQSLDQDLMAVVAVRVASFMPRHVPEIHVMNALLEGDIPQEFKGFHGSSRQSIQFIHG